MGPDTSFDAAPRFPESIFSSYHNPPDGGADDGFHDDLPQPCYSEYSSSNNPYYNPSCYARAQNLFYQAQAAHAHADSDGFAHPSYHGPGFEDETPQPIIEEPESTASSPMVRQIKLIGKEDPFA